MTAAVVDAAADDRAVVATWLMRGTLHLVSATDVHWLLSIFGPRNVAAGAGRRRELGLDDETCVAAMREIERVLTERVVVSRAELVAEVVRVGVAVEPTGQAPAHLMAYAAARGLICRGPHVGGEPGYVLLDDWVPAPADRDDDAALAKLARRYVAGFGPASAEDLAAWSGLPRGTARKAFALAADDLSEVSPGNYVARDAEPPPDPDGPVVRLVGAFDTYLLGYRDRTPVLDPRYATRIVPGGGLIHPAVLVDGRVVARWRLRRTRTRADVVIEPFTTVDPGLAPAIDAEVADLARFLGVDTRLIVAAHEG